MKEGIDDEKKFFQEIDTITDEYKDPYRKMRKILSIVEDSSALERDPLIRGILHDNENLKKSCENGDLRIKIWDRYYEKISEKKQWCKEIIEKYSKRSYKEKVDRVWLTKFMESIASKKMKRRNSLRK